MGKHAIWILPGMLALGLAGGPAFGQAPANEDPTPATDWFRLGAAELAAGSVDRAIEAYQKGVAARPEVREGWYNLGIAYGRKRALTKEAEAYQKALEIDPNYGNAWLNLGLCHLESGQHDKAVEALERLVALEPQAQDGWLALGSAQLARGEFQKAAEAFQRAATNDPKAADPWIHLGLLRMRQAEKASRTADKDPLLEEALGFFQEALNREGTRAVAWYNQGVVLHRLGRWDEEILAYQKALEQQPDHPASLFNLATAYSTRNRREEAIQTWKRYLDVAQKDPGEKSFLEAARREIRRLGSE